MEIFVFFMQVFGTGLLSPTALELCSLATEGTQEITERTEIIPSQAKSLSLTDDTDHTDGSLLRRELGHTERTEIAEMILYVGEWEDPQILFKSHRKNGKTIIYCISHRLHRLHRFSSTSEGL